MTGHWVEGGSGAETSVTDSRSIGDRVPDSSVTDSRSIGDALPTEETVDVRDMGDGGASGWGHALAEDMSHG